MVCNIHAIRTYVCVCACFIYIHYILLIMFCLVFLLGYVMECSLEPVFASCKSPDKVTTTLDNKELLHVFTWSGNVLTTEIVRKQCKNIRFR